MEDIIFVTAQPDVPYFHWQVKLYTHNFIEKGIKPCQIHVIFGLQNNSKLKNKIGFLIQHVIAIVRNAQVQQCVLYVVVQMQL